MIFRISNYKFQFDLISYFCVIFVSFSLNTFSLIKYNLISENCFYFVSFLCHLAENWKFSNDLYNSKLKFSPRAAFEPAGEPTPDANGHPSLEGQRWGGRAVMAGYGIAVV